MELTSIAIMAKYRNRMLEYVLQKHAHSHEHMLVLDLDLGVSISPLGVLHSLGSAPNDVVASRGLMVWHGTLGASVVRHLGLGLGSVKLSPTLVQFEYHRHNSI